MCALSVYVSGVAKVEVLKSTDEKEKYNWDERLDVWTPDCELDTEDYTMCESMGP